MRNDLKVFRLVPSIDPSHMSRALSLLSDAIYYAEDLDRSLWDFAVSIDEFRAVGFSENGLRWLCCKGFLDHAIEVTERGEVDRSFENSPGLVFSSRECFVLTDAGRTFASGETTPPADATLRNGQVSGKSPPVEPTQDNRIPTWDRVRRELRWEGVLVKQFKVPSPNQETILGVFEEEHWPIRIDDPLSPKHDQDPKRRLHDTINTLNRNQKNPLLRFFGDGSGQGIRWRPGGSERN